MDTIFGILIFYILSVNITDVLSLIHNYWHCNFIYFTLITKIEMREDSFWSNVEWIEGYPGGFKPNENLSFYLRTGIIFFIQKW